MDAFQLYNKFTILKGEFMKKILIFLPAILLSSCSFFNNDDGSFKNDYFAGELVTNTVEINTVLYQIENGPTDYKKIQINNQIESKNSHYSSKESSDIEINYYNDGFADYTEKKAAELFKNGIRSKTEVTNKTTQFFSKDLERRFTLNEGERYSYSSSTCKDMDAFYSGVLNLNSLLFKEGGFNSFNDFDLYKDENGKYSLIYSSIVETYQETEHHDDKMLYNCTRKQAFLSFDSYFAITSLEVYFEQQSNRDPVTAEWYSNNQIVSASSLSAKVTYGKREDIAEEERARIVSTFSRSLLTSISVVANYGIFDKDADKYTPSNYSRSSYAQIDINYIDTSNAEVIGKISILQIPRTVYSGENAFTFEILTKTNNYYENINEEFTKYVNCESFGYSYYEKNNINYTLSEVGASEMYFKFNAHLNSENKAVEINNFMFF